MLKKKEEKKVLWKNHKTVYELQSEYISICLLLKIPLSTAGRRAR